MNNLVQLIKQLAYANTEHHLPTGLLMLQVILRRTDLFRRFNTDRDNKSVCYFTKGGGNGINQIFALATRPHMKIS